MIKLFFVTFVLIPLLIQLLGLWSMIKFFRRIDRQRKQAIKNYSPKVIVLSPHRGWDEQTKQNAELILKQDYLDYEVFFLTNTKTERRDIADLTETDESYPHLLQLAKENPHAHVFLAEDVVSASFCRSQTLHNLLIGFSHLPEDAEVIAFVDADATVREDWLKRLVDPLWDEKIGATTGVQFYIPSSYDIPTLVVSMLIGGAMPFRFGNAWGGSMAIRLKTFKECQIEEIWKSSIAGDATLNRAIQEQGKSIFFVPDCAVTHQVNRINFRNLMTFTNRQMMHVYWVAMNRKGRYIITWLIASGLYLLAPFFIPFHPYFALALAVPCISILQGRLILCAQPKWLKESKKVKRAAWLMSLTRPITMFVSIISFIYASTHSKFTWSGIQYEYISATECRVLGRVNEIN
ncbi:hypothetical protein H8E77_16930 [bacterium]|nr:hypothetical protein [bacterium]